uniref:Large ribosomal subunit protein bL12m n=1 Tax=Steinernema glaseri TaxID=37863 RepID=A0A1I7Z2M9_9BILA
MVPSPCRLSYNPILIILADRMKLISSAIRYAGVARVAGRRCFSAAAAPAESPVDAGPASSTPDEPRVISPKIQEIVDHIASLSLLEVSDLNYALKKKLNIADTPMMAPGMMMAVGAAQPAAAAGEAAAEADIPQKMTFTVKLTKFADGKKIALIKEIRNIMPNLNLVQAKKFVETAPVNVKEDMGKAEAEEMKAALEKVGATVEIV